MKRFTVVLILAGCAGPTAAPATVNQELGVVMALSIQDPTQLKVGQTVRYTARREGAVTATATKLSCVGALGDKLWVEHKTPSGDQFIILKTLIDRAGVVTELWLGEPGTDQPRKLYPGLDANGKPINISKPAVSESKMEVKIEPDRITAAGRNFDCHRMTSSALQPDGTRTTMVTWCSPEVPFPVVYEGKSYGGVVRRVYGKHTLELTSVSDTGAQEELQLR